MLQKIDHINIVVKDLAKAKQFFLMLGFVTDPDKEGPLVGEWIERVTKLQNAKGYYCTLNLPGAQTNLELIQYDSPKDEHIFPASIPNQPGLRHLAFTVNDIETLVQKLKDQGITFFSEIQHYTQTNKKLCYFYGPDGIILELAEYH